MKMPIQQFDGGVASVDMVDCLHRVRDERSQSAPGLHDAAPLEFLVGARHGVGIDNQFAGHFPHGWQAVAQPKSPSRGHLRHLIYDLLMDGDAIVEVNPQIHVSKLIILVQ